MNGRLVELKFGKDDIDELRDAYRKHVDVVDEWVGRLMDEVPDDVFLFVLGDIGIALGEHDYAGRGTPTSHRFSYEVPFLIRHPRGEKAGDDIDWFASTHDVAPTLLSAMGLTIPGKMRGEDLTQLFDGVDEEDLPDRPFSITLQRLADHGARQALADGRRPRADGAAPLRRRRGGRRRRHQEALRRRRQRRARAS